MLNVLNAPNTTVRINDAVSGFVTNFDGLSVGWGALSVSCSGSGGSSLQKSSSIFDRAG